MAKIILDLCGGTGAWSKPYVDKGYDVRLITLPNYDVNQCTIDDRQITFYPLKEGLERIVVKLVQVHGILAAPPCTEFSLANTRTRYALRPDWIKGLIVVMQCMTIIQCCMAKGYTEWWALENPYGHLRKFLGRPGYEFHSWWFDDLVPWSKRTDLWGHFTKPVATVDERPARLSNVHRDEHRQTKAWYTPEVPKEFAELTLSRADIRAITPRGFAEAFAKVNR